MNVESSSSIQRENSRRGIPMSFHPLISHPAMISDEGIAGGSLPSVCGLRRERNKKV